MDHGPPLKREHFEEFSISLRLIWVDTQTMCFFCFSFDVSPFPKEKTSQAPGGLEFFLLRADSNPRAGFPIPIRYVM